MESRPCFLTVDEVVDNMRLILKGATAIKEKEIINGFQIIRSLPHGHVAAVLGTLKKIGLTQLIAQEKSRKRDLVIAMIVARIINPASKLATVRGLNGETGSSSLGKILNLEKADSDECYEALDWLVYKQETIEKQLAEKHLSEGSLILYDLTSTYFEGTHCDLAKYGYNRDQKKGKLQIRKLIPQQPFQLGLFDQKNLIEIESDDYPGERLVVCRNPLVAEKNTRTREELITATEELLKPIIAATTREKRPLKGAAQIGFRVGKVINKFKVGKYFELNIN